MPQLLRARPDERRLVLAGRLLQQVEDVADRIERIVNLMGEAGGHAADDGQPFRRTRALFNTPALGNVPDESGEYPLALECELAKGNLRGNLAAVFMLCAEFDVLRSEEHTSELQSP